MQVVIQLYEMSNVVQLPSKKQDPKLTGVIKGKAQFSFPVEAGHNLIDLAQIIEYKANSENEHLKDDIQKGVFQIMQIEHLGNTAMSLHLLKIGVKKEENE